MRVIRFVCSWRACAGGRQLECDPRAQPGVRAHGKKHTGRRTLKSFHPGVYTCAGDSSALIVLSLIGGEGSREWRDARGLHSEAARRVRHECGTGRESEDKQNHPH